MPQFLSLSRAARLAGVSRGELQHRIRTHGAETFEGQISLSTLLNLYPQVNLERDSVLERLEHIKAIAQPKTTTDGRLPTPEVLISRLHELSRALMRTKSALNVAEQVLRDVAAKLREPITEAALAEILNGIDQALAHPESAPDRIAQLFANQQILKVLTAHVRVQPSGHEFFVEGNESLLQAGLNAGLRLDYGCSSGNCGACRARVVQGTVRQIRDHDFILSARERAEGHILACSWTAVTDLELEVREARSFAELPQQTLRTHVSKVEPIDQDRVILHLRTPRTQSLRFMAGQSVWLTDEDGHGGRYPIASCPSDGHHLEIMIRHRPNDAFAQAVLDRRIDNQRVLVEGPSGDFVLREESTQPALFIAFGDGFAPIKSLLEHAISIDKAEYLHLYRLDAPLADHRLDHLCRAWGDALDNFSFTLLPAELSAPAILERLCAEIPDLARCDLYLAGPHASVDDLLNVATQLGLDPAQMTHTYTD
jgi:CDP-4-dehydro-6-deoxyglucose reductase, E3